MFLKTYVFEKCTCLKTYVFESCTRVTSVEVLLKHLTTYSQSVRGWKRSQLCVYLVKEKGQFCMIPPTIGKTRKAI